MGSEVLVTGGTGTLGRLVVDRLWAAGRPVRVLSRRDRAASVGVRYVRGDLVRDIGVEDAVAGVPAVIHCASSMRGDADAARHLVRALQATAHEAPAHLVYISIVGVQRIPYRSAVDRALFGYYRAKFEVEQIVSGSGLPWTTLRATQFHDLVFTVARTMSRLPVAVLPSGFRFQPVGADEVAARLVELADGPACGDVGEFGGPRVYPAADLLRSYLRHTGKRRAILPLHLPGEAAEAMRAGANVCPAHAEGRRSWEAFLDSRLPSAPDM